MFLKKNEKYKDLFGNVGDFLSLLYVMYFVGKSSVSRARKEFGHFVVDMLKNIFFEGNVSICFVLFCFWFRIGIL